MKVPLTEFSLLYPLLKMYSCMHVVLVTGDYILQPDKKCDTFTIFVRNITTSKRVTWQKLHNFFQKKICLISLGVRKMLTLAF